MPVARPAWSRPALCATLALLAGATLPAPAVAAQQPAETQAPAPVVRIRPRPETQPRPENQPGNAPTDAAPLVRSTPVPRPKPINPQALGGPAASTSSPQPHPHASAQPATGTAGTPSATANVVRPAVSATKAPEASAPARPALSATGLNRDVIVLDPAHGGVDSGSHLGENEVEKNVTLAFAFRLRALLAARGFTVVLTRESDLATAPSNPGSPLTLDDRAGIANHSRAAACLLLHATGRGNGVHIYTSELDAAPGEPAAASWLTAQAAWIPASQQLERSVSSALGRSRIALVSSTASVRPVDSLTCPALVLELAPENDDVRSINDAGYQDRVAAAVAGALVFWQKEVQAPPRLTPPAASTHHRASASATSSSPEVRP